MTTAQEPGTIALTSYQRTVADYWNATAHGDAQNVRLGELDDYYHHHYGIGPVNPDVWELPEVERDAAFLAELHRLEHAQGNLLLDQFERTRANQRLLDAGCGRGGTSIMAYERYHCQVDGVTISDYQVQFATECAKRHSGASTSVQFHLANMLDTGFRDGSYDGIWTNETTMYVDLDALFAEFARLLVPGGRYVAITGAHNDTWGSRISPAVDRINERYHCRVHPRSAYFTALSRHGLIPILVRDLTPDTIPYWRLRAETSIATGVEGDFLDAYLQGDFHYLLIVADRVRV